MSRVIVTCGIAGCGKTTWANQYSAEHPNCIVLDSDAIRQELWGNAEEQKNPSVIFTTMRMRMHEALQKGYDVIYCATNLKRSNRKQLLNYLHSVHPETVCDILIFNVSFDLCFKQNSNRDRQVPEYAMRRQFIQFMNEQPSLNEGWNSILEVTRDDDTIT